MSEELIELCAGDYTIVVAPDRGGSVARFDWRGTPIFRPSRPGSILNVGFFPLVPFCNRIARGSCLVHGRLLNLAPNMPDAEHPHPLHGFGWQSQWSPALVADDTARIVHQHEGGQWPYTYEATLEFLVRPDGVSMTLSATNLSRSAMPCGLGFHPYFERDTDACYFAAHKSEWQTSTDGLPIALRDAPKPVDWWNGAPVGTRSIDTVYEGREGPIRLTWPSRRLTVEILPSDNLSCTAVYTPPGADFFCIEPISHATDAINRSPCSMRMLEQAETMTASLTIRAVP